MPGILRIVVDANPSCSKCDVKIVGPAYSRTFTYTISPAPFQTSLPSPKAYDVTVTCTTLGMSGCNKTQMAVPINTNVTTIINPMTIDSTCSRDRAKTSVEVRVTANPCCEHIWVSFFRLPDAAGGPVDSYGPFTAKQKNGKPEWCVSRHLYAGNYSILAQCQESVGNPVECFAEGTFELSGPNPEGVIVDLDVRSEACRAQAGGQCEQ